jgi:succinoglycan biosynthesis transport protein ExoP
MRELELPQPAVNGYIRLPPPPSLIHGDFEPARPSVTPAHYLHVVWRQRGKIAAFVATCLLITYLISARITPIYEATAKIDVDRRIPQGVVGQDASQGTVGEDSDAFMATQMEIIQSDSVLRPVADKYDLLRQESQLEELGGENARKRTDAPTYLKQLKVTRPISTYLLGISYRSPDPQLAADVANAVAQSYLEHTFNIRLKATGALSKFMEKQLEELKAKMERSSLALSKFERKFNVINPEEKTSILSSRLLQLNTEYTSAQGDRLRKEAAYNAVKSGSVASAMISNQAEELARLQDRVNQAKQHVANIASIYGPNHNEYRKAANDLAEVERQFDETRDVVSQRVEADFQQAKNREEMLRKAVRATKGEYDELNSHSFEYQQLKRDAEADKGLYQDLERRIREAGINAGFQNNSIRIADLARPPDSPVFPRTKLNLLLALIASLVIGVCAAILADLLDNTIRDPQQAALALDISVLGTLPTVKEMRRLLAPGDPATMVEAASMSLNEQPSRAKMIRYKAEKAGKKNRKRIAEVELASFEDGFSAYEEAIRSLRHSILLPDLERSVKSLLITSATPSEGKSTAIVHLGIAHAEQGKRTLIVDADLRRPSIHKKLNLNGSLGLSNVLLGEFHWRETVLQTELYPNLSVLPAGLASRRASDLVGSMMLEILDEASKEYDLILVDAPPLLGFAEAMQVAKSVDGVVVLARAGQTNRRAVATVLATLKQLRANVIGLALSEVDKNSTNGYYVYGNYRKYYASNERHA